MVLVAAAATADNSGSSSNHDALLSAIVVLGFDDDDDDGVLGDAWLCFVCLFLSTLNLLATTNEVWQVYPV